MDLDPLGRDSLESQSEHHQDRIAADGSSRRLTVDGSAEQTESLVLWVGAEDENLRALQNDPRLRVVGPMLPERVELGSMVEFAAAIIDVDVGDPAFDTVLQLNEAEFPCRSVIIGSEIDVAIVREAFFVGVQACLRKPVEGRVLVAELLRAAEATRVMRQCIGMAGSDSSITMDRRALDISVLTTREREILQMLLEGRTTRRMAENLDVSPRTVKFHVSNLLRKLGAGSRLSLLAKIHQGSLSY
jgi:DNA-binding NarL/FixJ family response regulator